MAFANGGQQDQTKSTAVHCQEARRRPKAEKGTFLPGVPQLPGIQLVGNCLQGAVLERSNIIAGVRSGPRGCLVARRNTPACLTVLSPCSCRAVTRAGVPAWSPLAPWHPPTKCFKKEGEARCSFCPSRLCIGHWRFALLCFQRCLQ